MLRATLAVLSFLLALPAAAGVVEIWSETTLRFTHLGRAQATATSTGLATLHTTSASSSHLATLTLTGSSIQQTVPITDPASEVLTAAIFSVRRRPDLQGGGVLGNVSAAVAGTGALTPATLPHTGTVTLCLLFPSQPPCRGQLTLPMGATQTGQHIGFGVGGRFTIGSGSILVTLVGAPYTVGTVSVPNRTAESELSLVTVRGFAHGPASLTSSTAQAGGVLQIVTAQPIAFIGNPGDQDWSGLISSTLVHVIPEPALLALLGSGAVLAALLGSRRRR